MKSAVVDLCDSDEEEPLARTPKRAAPASRTQASSSARKRRARPDPAASPSPSSPPAEEAAARAGVLARALLNVPAPIARQVRTLLRQDLTIQLLRTASSQACIPAPLGPAPEETRFVLTYPYCGQTRQLFVMFTGGMADVIFEHEASSLPTETLRRLVNGYKASDDSGLVGLVSMIRREQRAMLEAQVRALPEHGISEAEFEACRDLGGVDWLVEDESPQILCGYHVPIDASLRRLVGEREEITLVLKFPLIDCEDKRSSKRPLRATVLAGAAIQGVVGAFKAPSIKWHERHGDQRDGTILAALLSDSAEKLKAFLHDELRLSVLRRRIVEGCLAGLGVPLEKDDVQWSRCASLVVVGPEEYPVIVRVSLPAEFPKVAPKVVLQCAYTMKDSHLVAKKLRLAYDRIRSQVESSPGVLVDMLRTAVTDNLPSIVDLGNSY